MGTEEDDGVYREFLVLRMAWVPLVLTALSFSRSHGKLSLHQSGWRELCSHQ